MTRLFFEAITQISLVFSGSSSNNCISQIQNTYLQEIIASCTNFQQLPTFQTKEIQQFQSSINTMLAPNTKITNKHVTLLFFQCLIAPLKDIFLPFLINFKIKIPLFDKRKNQEAQAIINKLKIISEINPKKLIQSGNKDISNAYNNSIQSMSAYPQPESETILRITLSSFLSFIYSIFLFKSNSKQEQQNNDENDISSYFFDITVYEILFDLLILSIQIKPPKGQIIESLKFAFMILLEIFISESFNQYNISYPPNKNLQQITSEQLPNEENKIQENPNSLFDKEKFSLILNKILSCVISNVSLFFPGIDNLLVGIEEHISTDHRSELNFFDKQLIKFITLLASKTKPSTFSIDASKSLIWLSSNQLLKFNKDSLDYFIALSKHNADSSNNQIVSMLVNSLTIELPKERVTNADNDIIKLVTKINKNRPKKNDEINFLSSLFPSKEIFNDCFVPPDTKYVIDLIVNRYIYSNETQNLKDEDSSFAPFAQAGYSKLVSKRIYNVIQVLSESFRRSNAMLDKLYMTFGKDIINSKSLFDSLCLFVVFYLESKSKWHFEPSTNPATFLLLQHLFSRKVLTKRKTIVQKLQMYTIGILIDKSEENLLGILQDIVSSYKMTDDDQNKSKETANENNKTSSFSFPTCPLFVLQILEGLIVNYRKLEILITNSSDSVLVPLSIIMDEMRKISYNPDYVNFYNVTYNEIESNQNESNKEPNFQRDIDRVRYTFLILVSLIFENNEAKKIIIDNLSFTKTFIDFVFEGKKVRDYILSQIENALITSKCDPSIAFIPNIIKIFEFIYNSDKRDPNYIEKTFYLLKDILSMINRTLSTRKDLCKYFFSFAPFIFQMISFINNVNSNSNDSNVELFRELTDLLSKISIFLQISENDKDIIKQSINKIWLSHSNNEPLPSWLYSSLIKLMVPDEKLIRQPVLLHLIFDYFNNDEYLKYLCDLMNENIFNVEKCCSVSFDQTIFRSFISDTSNFENQTLIKKLFTNIALIAISPSVVYQYLRLLSPKDSIHLNKNMNLYLKYLNELFILSLETQHESWALNPGYLQKAVTYDLTPKSDQIASSPKRSLNCYGDGYFTLVFWLKVEQMSPTYFPLIFSARDEKGNIYEVFIRGRKICINYDKTHRHSSLPFNYTFDKDQWYFVSLSFSNYLENQETNQNFCVVSMSVNEQKDQKLEVKFPASQMITGNTKFVFGGALHENSIRSTNPCLLGPFALFNMLLRPEKLQALYKQEQRFFCRDNKDPSCFHIYQPYADGPRQMQKNFASTLVLNVKLEVFVPLFLLIPMKFEDETFYPNYIETVIDIIKHGLNFGSIVEDSFYYANGFGIISFILSQSRYQKYCDYNLYSQFYSLFLNLMTETLKTEMIKNILLNFDLWSTIEKPDELVQIFDIWLNALFPHNLQIISKIYSFAHLLNLIVFNFCLKEDEHLIKFQYELPQLSKSFLSLDDQNDNNCRRKINLTEIQRQMINNILFQILLCFSVQRFTFDDYVLLVSYLMNSQSSDLILNIKKLLLQMIILIPSPLEPILDNNVAFSKLHQVFVNKAKHSSIDAIESVIEIIIFLHKASMIKGNQIIPNVISRAALYSTNTISSSSFLMNRFLFSSLKTVNLQSFSLIDHLYTIFQQIPREIFGKRDFLNRLINLTEKISPEIFPFVCWSAFCIMNDLGSNQTKENRREMLLSIFSKLEPSHEFVTKHWSFIPILLVIKVNNKIFAEKMINFLIDCCKGDESIGVFFTILILCNVFHTNAMKYQRIFLLKVLNDAVSKSDQKSFSDILIQITTFYIFYRNIEFDNIGKFFPESPFKTTKPASKSTLENSSTINNFSVTTICSFFSQVSSIDISTINTTSRFGLRFHKVDKDYKWIDRDIAILILKYTSDYQNNESIYCLRLLLIYYILHQNDDPKFILATIKELDKPKFSNSNNEGNTIGFSFNSFISLSQQNFNSKRQEIIQMLVDLVCFQIEKICLTDICPLFKYRSENFRLNGNSFFTLVYFIIDDKEIYDYFFASNILFSKRIQDISTEILKSSNIEITLPSFITSLDQQQQNALSPFFDSSYFPNVDTLKVFEISQMEAIIKKINDMYNYKHLFKDLLESITTSKAPLYTLSKFRKNGKFCHMKRDKILVAQLIPLRMKTSWLFDDHIDAMQEEQKIPTVINNSLIATEASATETNKTDESPKTATEKDESATKIVLNSQSESSADSNSSIHFSKVPSLQGNVQLQQAPLKGSRSRVRRISTMMKKRLMLSSSTCYVHIDSDCIKKNCELVSIDKTEDAFLTLTTNEIKILKLKNFKLIHVYFYELRRTTKTKYLHKPISLQLITTKGTEFFINFETNENRDAIFNFIVSHSNSSNISFFDQVERSTRLWLEESMTNFEYLILINMASGRSFQNSSQYPIFPIVFNNYDKNLPKTLTHFNSHSFLRDQQVYRNFSRPSGALDDAKFEILKKNQNILKKIQPENAFLFPTGASNPQILYGELARIEPFLSLYITLQGGKISDEAKSGLLSSIPSLYESVLHDITDFRELLPEFFAISPEFLEVPEEEIEEKVKFGSVSLPPWFNCFDHRKCILPAEFLYLHRKALESNFVRANLNSWIDLVFGVNQKSENNVYENSLYEETGINLQMNEKKIWRKKSDMTVKTAAGPQNEENANLKELEASKRVLGQVPLKLFIKPHPQCSVICQTPRRTLRSSTTIEKPNFSKEKKNSAPRSTSIIASKQLRKEINAALQEGSTDNRRTSLGDMNNMNLKFTKSMSQNLIQLSPPIQEEKKKDEESLGNIRTPRRSFSIYEHPDEMQAKKQQQKLRQIRDMHFNIRRVDLKKYNLIFASVYSSTKKSVKIHSIDKYGNRYLFLVDSLSLDIIYTKVFSGEPIYNIIIPPNQNTQKSGSLQDSILGTAPFRDCIFIISKDKSILLDSDGNISVNGRVITNDTSNTNTPDNSIDLLQKKKYFNIAFDSECLAAAGPDSLIDIFSSLNTRVKPDPSKSYSSLNTSNDSNNMNSQINLKSSLITESSNSIDFTNSSSLSLSQTSPPNQGPESSSFFFSDTLSMMKRPKRSLHFFSENKVTCMAVSSVLNSLAVASNDGCIFLYSLHKGSTIIELTLPSSFVAQKIVFTKSLGLIVVYAITNENEVIHSIFTFTINGEMIRRRAIPCSKGGIEKIAAFISKKGIDYIAFVTKDDKQIHICEAFLLDFENFKPPQQIEKMMNENSGSNSELNSNSQFSIDKEKVVNDSPLVLRNSMEEEDENDGSDDEENDENEEEEDSEDRLIKRQLSLPFPAIFKFDDHLAYLGYKRKLASLLYITNGGEFGIIPINRLITDEY